MTNESLNVCFLGRSSGCGSTSLVSVVPEAFISACVEDCGTYGECRLLRSYSYLYAACVCKAGRAPTEPQLYPSVAPFTYYGLFARRVERLGVHRR